MNLKLICEKNLLGNFNSNIVNFSKMDLMRKINRLSTTVFILCFVSLITPAKADYMGCIEGCANSTPNGSFQQLVCYVGCTVAWPIAKAIELLS
jgi:hypothetical protein